MKKIVLFAASAFLLVVGVQHILFMWFETQPAISHKAYTSFNGFGAISGGFMIAVIAAVISGALRVTAATAAFMVAIAASIFSAVFVAAVFGVAVVFCAASIVFAGITALAIRAAIKQANVHPKWAIPTYVLEGVMVLLNALAVVAKAPHWSIAVLFVGITGLLGLGIMHSRFVASYR